MLPDIDSLALFVRVAELGNLTRAAEASHITVPAPSRRLGLLEQQMNAQLFERHSRGMELTPAGIHLLGLARDLVARMQQLRAEMINYASGQDVVLRVNGNTSAMAQFLPGDIARFQARHANFRIVLEECWSEEAVQRVRTGVADLGVVVAGVDFADLWSVPYRIDRLAAVMRRDDPILADSSQSAENIAFSQILERDLVGLEGSSSLTRLLTAQADTYRRPMALRVQVRSFEAVCRSVDAKLGIGVLPQAAASHYAAALKLVVLPLADQWARRHMTLVLRQQPQPDSALGLLSEHLRACAQRSADRAGRPR